MVNEQLTIRKEALITEAQDNFLYLRGINFSLWVRQKINEEMKIFNKVLKVGGKK